MNNKVLGNQGEQAAADYLQQHGYRICARNFRVPVGEIDIIASYQDTLVFVEVKTRSSEDWGRPAAAVDAERRRRLTRAGLDYLHRLRDPPIKVRFDIVEVLLHEEGVRDVRHLPNSFAMERPYRYG